MNPGPRRPDRALPALSAAVWIGLTFAGLSCSTPPSQIPVDVLQPQTRADADNPPSPEELDPQPVEAPNQEPAKPPPASPTTTKSARDWLALGDEAYARKDLSTAEDAYRKASDLDSTLTPAYLGLALALRKQDRLEGSLLATEEALRLQPDYAEALANLGNLRFRTGQPDEAKKLLRRAIELKPDHAEAHLTLGVVLHAEGDLQGAADAYRRSAELDPTVVLAHSNLGIALDGLGDNTGAIEAYRRAIEINPEYAPAHNGLGKVLWQDGQVAEAVQAMQQAVRLQPDFALAHLNLVAAMLELEQFERAWDHLYQARALGAEPVPGLLDALAKRMPDPRRQPTSQPADPAPTNTDPDAEDDTP